VKSKITGDDRKGAMMSNDFYVVMTAFAICYSVPVQYLRICILLLQVTLNVLTSGKVH
jgi:hypothetical protein